MGRGGKVLIATRPSVYFNNINTEDMSNLFASSPQNCEKDSNQTFTHSPLKIRQAKLSPFKEHKQEPSNKPNNKFASNDVSRGNDTLPPRAVPFRRSRDSSRDKIQQNRENSTEFKSSRGHYGSDGKTEIQQRIQNLEKRIVIEVTEKQKWKVMSASQQQRLKKYEEELIRLQQEKQSMSAELLSLKESLLSCEKNLLKANETIDSLNKSLKECRVNQKSLSNIKHIQNQLEALQARNCKLAEQNQELIKCNKRMSSELSRKKDSTSDSQAEITKKHEKIQALQLQNKRLKEELHKDKTQRQIILQTNYQTLQKKLFEKQSELKKLQIQLNFIDRKKYMSIDEVKTKKDQEIKDLRQRFMKVSRDLKETKDKIEEKEKKRLPKQTPNIKKVKSSKVLGMTSQSEQVTFQLSSEF